MSTIIMNMCGRKTEREVLTGSEYGDEVLSAGWNPVVALQHPAPAAKHAAMPAELVSVDVEQFLKKMYAAQT
jgi:hypothetical protein